MPYLSKPVQCNTKGHSIAPRLMLWLLCLLLTLCVIPTPCAYAQGVNHTITDVRFDSSEDAIRMVGNVRFNLSDSVQNTLDRGIPVYFLFETTTSQARWYWTDKTVYKRKRYIRLTRQPLTRRWRVNVSNEPFNRGLIGVTPSQNYDTLEAALRSIKRISNWQVLDLSNWSDDATYTVHTRFRIDLSQLQQPLRIGTVGESDWKLDIERSFSLSPQNLGKMLSN